MARLVLGVAARPWSAALRAVASLVAVASMVAVASILVVAPFAAAEATLFGRKASFRVVTYDADGKPLFEGRRHVAPVGEGFEFGLGPEGAQNGIDVVPVRINVSDFRVEFDYALTPAGSFLTAAFNGYEIRFDTECALLKDARLDQDFTTLPLASDAVFLKDDALYVNVSGLSFQKTSRFALDLELADCPIS